MKKTGPPNLRPEPKPRNKLVVLGPNEEIRDGMIVSRGKVNSAEVLRNLSRRQILYDIASNANLNFSETAQLLDGGGYLFGRLVDDYSDEELIIFASGNCARLRPGQSPPDVVPNIPEESCDNEVRVVASRDPIWKPKDECESYRVKQNAGSEYIPEQSPTDEGLPPEPTPRYFRNESEVRSPEEIETQRAQADLENAISSIGISLAEIRAIESGEGVLYSRPLSTYSPAEKRALENIKLDKCWAKEFSRIRRIAEGNLAEINRQSRADNIERRKAEMNRGLLARLFGRKTCSTGQG